MSRDTDSGFFGIFKDSGSSSGPVFSPNLNKCLKFFIFILFMPRIAGFVLGDPVHEADQGSSSGLFVKTPNSDL